MKKLVDEKKQEIIDKKMKEQNVILDKKTNKIKITD